MDQDELIDEFSEWYIVKYGGAGSAPRLEKIKEAHWAPKEILKKVGTIRKIEKEDWVWLGVPIGIAKS